LHAERKNEQEIPKELWPFHPGRFKEVVDEQTGLILGWVYNRGVKKIPLQPTRWPFSAYFNPYHDRTLASHRCMALPGSESQSPSQGVSSELCLVV
jgi:hypothetical protein